MSVVKINAISVPEGAGPELEKRFAARKHAVDQEPGFEGFQLLRPTAGEDRYFVVTTWASEEDFQRWRDGRMPAAHAAEQGGRPAPVAPGADLLEFDVVDLGCPGRRCRRIAFTMTSSTDASCTSMPTAIVTPPASSPASRATTVTREIAMFCRITRTVRRARSSACGSRSSRSPIRAMSAVSMATPEPAAPMATPMSAVARAGASLTPSPTIATTRPLSLIHI